MNYLRLKKQSDFQKLFAKGKRMFSKSLTVIYTPSGHTRMGISVGKRHGKAVERNRIKRLLREAFRLSVPFLEGKYTFVLLPKVREKYSFKNFERELQCMIKKEKL